MNAHKAIGIAEELFGLPEGSALSVNRKGPIVRCRQALMWALMEMGESSAAVGRLFDFDHTTVLYGVRTCRSNMLGNPGYASQCRKLLSMLGRSAAKTTYEQAVDFVESQIQSAKVQVLEPEFWTSEEFLRQFALDLARRELARYNPRKVRLVPLEVFLNGETWRLRFESAVSKQGKLGFQLLDIERLVTA